MNGSPHERPLRVLLISPSFGVFGGMEAFVLAVAKYLAGDARVSVRVCFKKVKGFVPTAGFIKACQDNPADVKVVGRFSVALIQSISWAEIVHAQNAPPDVVLLSKLMNKFLVLTIHNWHRQGGSLRERLWTFSGRQAQRRWYNSQFVRGTWEGNRPWKDSSVVPTVSELPEGEVPVEERSGFVFAARWIPNKGLEVLIEAYRRANLDRQRWPLRLIGDGPLREGIEKDLRERPVSGIELMGFITPEHKAEVIRHARWIVAPPHTNEDLGLTAIEARHVGVPCIVSRDGGLPEAAGAEALICEPGDVEGLQKLLEEASLMPAERYEKKARASRESLKNYLKPMSFYVEQYLEVTNRNCA